MSQNAIAPSEPMTGARHNRIVAGFDESEGSVSAIEWAAREATVRGSQLCLAMGAAVPEAVDFYGIGARQTSGLRSIAERVASEHTGLDVEVRATVQDPREALIIEAQSSDLLVVGSRHTSGAKRLLFGSVAHAAARRGPCPVVVVRGPEVRQPIRKIAVGADGSSAADAALVWAAEEADLHGAEIVVVHAWDRDHPLPAATVILDDAVALCRQHTRATVTGQMFRGDAAAGLVAASREADLIAIGSRGRSGFKTALFGSVTLNVAEHSHCPVAVTHPRQRTG
jgi:nucleotide-binding universal stress UspA family protein